MTRLRLLFGRVRMTIVNWSAFMNPRGMANVHE
jgi:hypothetical protein